MLYLIHACYVDHLYLLEPLSDSPLLSICLEGTGIIYLIRGLGSVPLDSLFSTGEVGTVLFPSIYSHQFFYSLFEG